VLQPHPRLPPEGCRRYGIVIEQQLVFHDFLLALELVPPLASIAIYSCRPLSPLVFRSFCGAGRDVPILGRVSTNGS
jgi:hypothetical protein